ncbi:MAG TPA: S9 family peptidase [Kofleriaceae bacterium]|nr:S9 family peptidase [Kofleriaceae bacterium]
MIPRSRWMSSLSLAAAMGLALGACGSTPAQSPATLPEGPAPGSIESPASDGTAAAATMPPPPPMAKGNPSNDLIDRRVLFGNPERANVQISHDGRFVSWLAPKDGVLNVFVAPVGKLAEARAITADTTRPVRTYFWAYDNQHLLYLQDKGGDENFHLHRVSVADGKVTDLTPMPKVRAQVLGLSHRKPDTILVELNDRDPAVFDIWQLSLSTGEKTRIVENKDGFAGWISDDDHRVRFGLKVAPDGTNLVYQPDGKGGWTEFDRASARDSFNGLGFSKRGDQLYVTDDRDRDTAALYLMDAKTKAKKLIFADDKADVDNVIFHPTENTVLAVSVKWDRERLTVLDKTAKADFDGIAKLGDGDARVVSATKDNKAWIVAMTGDRQPTRFFVWNRTKKQGTLLFSSRPDLEGKPLARMHPVVIKARDGLSLVSYLTLPNAADANADGKADRPGPAVLLVHGGPWARDNWGFNGLHQLLANRGYAVLSVNFRGSTGFGKSFLNAGNGEWGKKMHDDLIDATQWLIAQGVAPQDKVCVMGGSYGGYSTLAGLTLTPDTFACGVDIVGPSNILTLLESIPPYWAPILGVFKFRVGDWSTPEGKQKLLDVSPLTHVARIKRPLLIGQGANDPRVKQAESDQIVKAMQAKGLPVSYVLFPDEGHGFARPENNLVFMASAEAFLSAHLGGTYQPVTKEDLSASTVKVVTGKEGLPGWP